MVSDSSRFWVIVRKGKLWTISRQHSQKLGVRCTVPTRCGAEHQRHLKHMPILNFPLCIWGAVLGRENVNVNQKGARVTVKIVSFFMCVIFQSYLTIIQLGNGTQDALIWYFFCHEKWCAHDKTDLDSLKSPFAHSLDPELEIHSPRARTLDLQGNRPASFQRNDIYTWERVPIFSYIFSRH